jgi:tRNA-modifying protein YgfZ
MSAKTMLKPLQDRIQTVALTDLGLLRIKGRDGALFLQGQLSNDMKHLTSERSVLGGYHNPQGRTIAVLHLLRTAPEEILALLPRELAAGVAAKLARFILRAKVSIEDVSQSLRIDGLIGAQEAPPPAAAATVVRVAGESSRWFCIQPAVQEERVLSDRQLWRRLDIAAGLPQVYAATSEEFVAQMLNLDALGAIAFDKGCYTGQEVIARAHYRGRVKRRMQRFKTHASQKLLPGSAGRLSDGRAFKVVDAVAAEDGSCEFLAVAAVSARDEAQGLEGEVSIEAETLPLPYELPP